MMTTDPGEAAALAKEALEMAERATTLDPTSGWSQAAHGWTLVVTGDTVAGLRRARIGAELEPQDGHVLDLIGISALVANEPSLMAEVSHPDVVRVGSGSFGYNNIYGASQLMLENYGTVIDFFSTAAERGHPVSAPSLFLLATAYSELGDRTNAVAALTEMKDTWPSFPAEAAARKFFRNDPETLNRVLAALSLLSD
jgi:Flp pilus assembly protein TadD